MVSLYDAYEVEAQGFEVNDCLAGNAWASVGSRPREALTA